MKLLTPKLHYIYWRYMAFQQTNTTQLASRSEVSATVDRTICYFIQEFCQTFFFAFWYPAIWETIAYFVVRSHAWILLF